MRIKDSQFPVSPDGIRSGFVNTPREVIVINRTVDEKLPQRGTHQLFASPLDHAAL